MEQDIATRETNELISSSKVEGTAVYNRAGERLGSISSFMVGKRSGKVEYAVLSFGGFLGMGQDHYPLPWDMLDYETSQGGYVVDIDKERLESAPRYGQNEEPTYDRDYGQRVHSYYGMPYPY